MPISPFSQTSTTAFQSVQMVATDMDGTLTTAGRFTPALLQTFEQLAAAGIEVLIVTGRSAGWVSGLAHYLPVWGAIAENGGLLYAKATGLLSVLQKYFPNHAAENIVTGGDSPNDASLFDARCFPLSVGVANVLDYSDQLLHQPAYMALLHK